MVEWEATIRWTADDEEMGELTAGPAAPTDALPFAEGMDLGEDSPPHLPSLSPLSTPLLSTRSCSYRLLYITIYYGWVLMAHPRLIYALTPGPLIIPPVFSFLLNSLLYSVTYFIPRLHDAISKGGM